MTRTTTFNFHGNKEMAKRFIGLGRKLNLSLRNGMTFQNLDQDKRTLVVRDEIGRIDAIIIASSVFGKEVIDIYSPMPEEEKKVAELEEETLRTFIIIQGFGYQWYIPLGETNPIIDATDWKVIVYDPQRRDYAQILDPDKSPTSMNPYIDFPCTPEKIAFWTYNTLITSKLWPSANAPDRNIWEESFLIAAPEIYGEEYETESVPIDWTPYCDIDCSCTIPWEELSAEMRWCLTQLGSDMDIWACDSDITDTDTVDYQVRGVTGEVLYKTKTCTYGGICNFEGQIGWGTEWDGIGSYNTNSTTSEALKTGNISDPFLECRYFGSAKLTGKGITSCYRTQYDNNQEDITSYSTSLERIFKPCYTDPAGCGSNIWFWYNVADTEGIDERNYNTTYRGHTPIGDFINLSETENNRSILATNSIWHMMGAPYGDGGSGCTGAVSNNKVFLPPLTNLSHGNCHMFFDSLWSEECYFQMYFYGWFLLNESSTRDPCNLAEETQSEITATYKLYDVICQGELLRTSNGEEANPLDYREYYKCWYDIEGNELPNAPLELPLKTTELTEKTKELINAINDEITGPLIFSFTNYIVKGNDDNPDI